MGTQIENKVSREIESQKDQIASLIRKAGIEDPNGKVLDLCISLMIIAGTAGGNGAINAVMGP